MQHTETLYEWVHLSCAMWTPGPIVTPKTPVRLYKIDVKRFNLQCIICGQKNNGSCVQCQHPKCLISFHIECARRANYFMEVDRVERERFHRIFCEKHRPLKIVREQEERDKQNVEEVYKFAKVIEKSLEVNDKVQAKLIKLKMQTPFTRQQKPQPSLVQKRQEKLNLAKAKEVEKTLLLVKKRQAKLNNKHAEARVRVKKWRERDKTALLERVKLRYLQLLKLRVNLVMVDPHRKQVTQQLRTLKKLQSMA